MTFQIHALPAETFAPLFGLDDAALTARNARRLTAEAAPGFPCRVSLADAPAGDTVLLVNHCSLDRASPYRATHAVFVREGAATGRPAPGEMPRSLSRRLLSLRAFDADAMMIAAEIVEGIAAAEALTAMLSQPAVVEVHLHYATRGCYAARATRAE